MWNSDCKNLVNRFRRKIIDMLKSVLGGIVVQETGLQAEIALLNTQCRYCLLSLAVWRSLPMRDILPVTLRWSGKQAQSGIQLESDA